MRGDGGGTTGGIEAAWATEGSGVVVDCAAGMTEWRLVGAATDGAAGAIGREVVGT